MVGECTLVATNNVLLAIGPVTDAKLKREFCGTVIEVNEGESQPQESAISGKTIYVCGDLSLIGDYNLKSAERVLVVEDLCTVSGSALAASTPLPHSAWSRVSIGQVPLTVYGLGVLYREYFRDPVATFQRIQSEHEFQALTESNKPGTAHRTGIYLTKVAPLHRRESGTAVSDDLHFHLLRCSTNLSGPTENFGATDRHIVDSLNQDADRLFEDGAELNHVLAQIYHNTPATADKKQTKAKISAHADKTKDMPRNGLMAFCTFYDNIPDLKPMEGDPHDLGHKGVSALTKLYFRRKVPVVTDAAAAVAVAEPEVDDGLPARFTVTLYPGSVFFMPLSTNRLYTHEIRPSALDVQMIPRRMGYVVRCSATEAVHRQGKTYITRHAGEGEGSASLDPLEEPTPEGMRDLRKLYAKENATTDFISYGSQFKFSMNKGDYTAPTYSHSNEFRTYNLDTGDVNLFPRLDAAIKFESVGKGRMGAVVLDGADARGTPIVRTTSKYVNPAQPFDAVYYDLINRIRHAASLPHQLNNALVEKYTTAYSSMGYHSDQALDLARGTHVAVYSCYKDPSSTQSRKLVVTSKEDESVVFEVPLTHNSLVVFSLDTNTHFRHKIILDTARAKAEEEWLGVTLRTSKTFVTYDDNGGASFNNGEAKLALVDGEEDRKSFFSLRSRENKEIGFTYPPISLTISPSDLVPPKTLVTATE